MEVLQLMNVLKDVAIHIGVVQRVCQSNSQWSGDVPRCKSKLELYSYRCYIIIINVFHS